MKAADLRKATTRVVSFVVIASFMFSNVSFAFTQSTLRQNQAAQAPIVKTLTEEIKGKGSPSTELGGEVANVRSLGNLLRILDVFRKSEKFPSITEKSSNGEIIEFLIQQLDHQGFIKTKWDKKNDVIVIEIKNKATKNNKIAQAIRKWVINPEGGVKAINFQGKYGTWRIVGFASELKDADTLNHEFQEVWYRQDGISWEKAHNYAVADLGKGEKIYSGEQLLFSGEPEDQYKTIFDALEGAKERVRKGEYISAERLLRKIIFDLNRIVKNINNRQILRNLPFAVSKKLTEQVSIDEDTFYSTPVIESLPDGSRRTMSYLEHSARDFLQKAETLLAQCPTALRQNEIGAGGLAATPPTASEIDVYSHYLTPAERSALDNVIDNLFHGIRNASDTPVAERGSLTQAVVELLDNAGARVAARDILAQLIVDTTAANQGVAMEQLSKLGFADSVLSPDAKLAVEQAAKIRTSAPPTEYYFYGGKVEWNVWRYVDPKDRNIICRRDAPTIQAKRDPKRGTFLIFSGGEAAQSKLAAIGPDPDVKYSLSEETAKNLQTISDILRKDILGMLFKAGSGHPGGSLSSAEIFSTLYFSGILNHDPNDPKWENRDRVVVSAGHKAPAVYAALAEAGYFSKTEFDNLRKSPEAMLQGHIDMNKTPGVDWSTGALGQGFSASCGMAAAARLQGKNLHTWAILGGGEEQEGQISEAARHAAKLGLTNLTAVLDDNGYQIEGSGKQVDTADVAKVWEGYGWNVIKVDGHNVSQLYDAMRQAKNNKDKPTLIIAKTQKGKGVKYFEDNPADSHGSVPKDETIRYQALTDVSKALGEYSFTEVEDFIRSKQLNGSKRSAVDKQNIKTETAKLAEVTLKELKPGDKIATRSAFGEMMNFLGSTNPNLVAMSADLQPSANLVKFEDLFGLMSPKNPQGRYVALGIREAHGASFAAGMSSMGIIPIIATFDIFSLNMVPQIRAMVQAGVPVIFEFTHSGVGVGEDGTSHQSIEAPGVMDILSGPLGDKMDIYEPGDAQDTRIVLENAIKAGKPVYIRLTRQDVLVLDKSKIENYEQKVAEGSYILRDPGKGKNDLIIVATGATVAEAIKASEEMEKEKGLKVKVINVVSLNKIDNEGNPFQSYLENGTPVITVCDAVNKVLQNPVLRAAELARQEGRNIGSVYAFGVTKLGSASPRELYALNGLDAAGIKKSALGIAFPALAQAPEYFVGGQEVDFTKWEYVRDTDRSQIRQRGNPTVVAKRQSDGKFTIYSGGLAAGEDSLCTVFRKLIGSSRMPAGIGMTQRDLAAPLSLEPSMIIKYLEILQQLGLVKQIGSDKGYDTLFKLTEEADTNSYAILEVLRDTAIVPRVKLDDNQRIVITTIIGEKILGGEAAEAPSPLLAFKEIGEEIWVDGVTWVMIRSGKFEDLVRIHGITGVTTNPPLIKAYLKDEEVLAKAAKLASEGRTSDEVYFELIKDLALNVIDIFKKCEVKGKFSIELDPNKANDVKASVEEAMKWIAIAPEYMMVKVAVNEAGYQIIEDVTALGGNVNATLIFTPQQYEKVAQAYIRGLERASEAGLNLSKIYSVASFFISRWDVKLANDIPAEYHGMFANAVAIDAYNNIFKQVFASEQFKALQAKGAQVQKFLLASTGTKAGKIPEPFRAKYPFDVYVSEVAGKDVVNTLPYEEAIVPLIQNKTAVKEKTIETNADLAQKILQAMREKGIDLDKVGDVLFQEGMAAFVTDFNSIQGTVNGVVQEQALVKIQSIANVVDKEILTSPIMKVVSHQFSISTQETTGLVVSANAVAEVGALLVGLANRETPICVFIDKDNKDNKTHEKLLAKLNEKISAPANKIQKAYSFNTAVNNIIYPGPNPVQKITFVVATEEEAKQVNLLKHHSDMVIIAKNIIEALGQIENMKDMLEEFRKACSQLGIRA